MIYTHIVVNDHDFMQINGPTAEGLVNLNVLELIGVCDEGQIHQSYYRKAD